MTGSGGEGQSGGVLGEEKSNRAIYGFTWGSFGIYDIFRRSSTFNNYYNNNRNSNSKIIMGAMRGTENRNAPARPPLGAWTWG